MNKEAKFEKDFNFNFSDKVLLKRALTHCSYQKSSWGNNERLEFLGDAVVDLVIVEYLFKNMQRDEGKMSNIKSIAIGRKIMAEIAKDIDLVDYGYLGKSEKLDIDMDKISLLSNLLEAVIGAVYLDKNFLKAKEFILKLWEPYLQEIVHKKNYKNYKSRLQEIVQKNNIPVPKYKVLEKKGPPHDRTFKIACFIENELYARAAGKSKKEAEFKAAKKTLKKIKKELK